jgi:N-carbamoylputrescine amidase
MRAALIQMKASMKREENHDRAEEFLKEAARQGAQVACLQEIFATWFFAQTLDPKHQELAEPIDGPTVTRMRAVARALKLWVVVPFYERVMSGELYNATVLVDAGGAIVGHYRKHHIPMSSHFQEKFYFRPGNLGYPVFDSPYGRIGIMICYDRHFPEAARALGLNGAQVVFVPTATTRRGFSRSVWEAELRGHAIANGFFVGGVNRVGKEADSDYYGASVFIDPIGQTIAQAGDQEEVLVADLSMERLEEVRQAWPFYRDRRPDSYARLVQP